MLCPKCRVDLERKQSKGGAAELDRCPKCQGIWFDDGEVAAIIGANAVPQLKIPPNAVTKEDLPCPRCGKPLKLFTYPGTVTLIEACGGCRGLWLDGGEIQAIAKSRAEKTPRPSAQATPSREGFKDKLIEMIDGAIESLWGAIRR